GRTNHGHATQSMGRLARPWSGWSGWSVHASCRPDHPGHQRLGIQPGHGLSTPATSLVVVLSVDQGGGTVGIEVPSTWTLTQQGLSLAPGAPPMGSYGPRVTQGTDLRSSARVGPATETARDSGGVARAAVGSHDMTTTMVVDEAQVQYED